MIRLFRRKKKRPPLIVATFPDGRRFVISKVGPTEWEWDQGKIEPTLRRALRNALIAGAKITRESK